MRLIPAILACAFIAASASPSFADSKVFIVANQPDGYGIDQCLANSERCGASAARAYCQSHEFAQASAYRKLDPDEITGAVPVSTGACRGGACDEYVAITCQR